MKPTRRKNIDRVIRRYTHKAIVWYLNRCGRAFHHGPYGDNGRYVVLMTDRQYHEYNKL